MSFCRNNKPITPEIQDQYGKNSRKPEFTVHIYIVKTQFLCAVVYLVPVKLSILK